MRVLVVVIGDLGRSPRMLAHAGSLLRAGHEVHLVGGTRTSLPAILRDHPQLSIHSLEGGEPARGSGLSAVLATSTRGVRLAWRLARAILWDLPPADLVLVQNPPALPTLPVVWFATRVRRARFVVDWHNLGWTVLALRFEPGHPLVRLTRWVEYFFGARADAQLAVSQRLADHLTEQGVHEISVLHDGTSTMRPLARAQVDLPEDPLIVIAPMGWSRDDDLPLLAEALQLLSQRLAHADGPAERRMRLLVSGNGPLRAEWAPRLRAMSGSVIEVETPDVPAEQYPDLLSSSHLGLSIHRSSSGLDLPMKVVEFLTVGIPSFVLEDSAPLDEIAPLGCGVVRYRTAGDLTELLQRALEGGAGEPEDLEQLSERAAAHHPESWDDRWVEAMVPLGLAVK